MTRSVLAALAAAVVATTPLAAQSITGMGGASSTKGLFLGASLNGSAVSADDLSDETDSGGGFALQLGYGFTPRLALVLDGTASLINSASEDYSLGHFDVLLRYAFTGETRRFVPFLEAGYSGRAAVQEDVELFLDDGSYMVDDMSLGGTGFTFGGGAQYYVAPKFALGAGLKWTLGSFDTVKYGDVSIDDMDIDATSARFNVGFTWYPMAGR